VQPQESIGVRVRMRWLDFSPALHHYTTRRIEIALRRVAAKIRGVTVQIADTNGPRGGPDDKICEVEVLLRPAGSLTVSANAPDPYLAVDRSRGRPQPGQPRTGTQRSATAFPNRLNLQTKSDERP
jgi:putative sigma-54 modulation protein